MNRGILNTKGITVTELIISTFVVGIVMVGIVSADYAIRRYHDTAFQSTQAVLGANVIVSHMLSKAFLATGTASDPGIGLALNTPTTLGSVCIQTNENAVPPWACYTFVSSRLYTCFKATSGSSCANTDTDLGSVSSVVTTWNNITAQGAQNSSFSVVVTVPDASNLSTGNRIISGSISPSRQSL